MTSNRSSLECLALPERPKRPVRLGIIGCGFIIHEAYIPSIVMLQDAGWPVEVVAIADLSEERRAPVQAQFPGARVFADGGALLESGLCDAVLLLLWPPFTLSYTEEALRRGLAVLVEKPAAGSSQELLALHERIGDGAGRVHVAYNRPQQPLLRRWRDVIGERWSDPASTLEVRLWRPKRDEPQFLSFTAVHALSLLHSQLPGLTLEEASWGSVPAGKSLPAWVRATLRAPGGPAVTLDIRPATGRAIETYHMLSPEWSCRLDYLVHLGLTDTAGLTCWERGQAQVEYRHAREAPMMEAALVRGFVHQLARFVRLAAGDDAAPVFSVSDAANVLRLWEQIAAVAK